MSSRLVLLCWLLLSLASLLLLLLLPLNPRVEDTGLDSVLSFGVLTNLSHRIKVKLKLKKTLFYILLVNLNCTYLSMNKKNEPKTSTKVVFAIWSGCFLKYVHATVMVSYVDVLNSH